MFKSYLFVLLYIATGIIGWQAYNAISTQDTSLPAIKNFMISNIPGGSYFATTPPTGTDSRISENRARLEKYEKELAQLRSLPPEALPKGIIKPEVKEQSIIDNLPQWGELKKQLTTPSEESLFIKRLKEPLVRETE